MREGQQRRVSYSRSHVHLALGCLIYHPHESVMEEQVALCAAGALRRATLAHQSWRMPFIARSSCAKLA